MLDRLSAVLLDYVVFLADPENDSSEARKEREELSQFTDNLIAGLIGPP